MRTCSCAQVLHMCVHVHRHVGDTVLNLNHCLPQEGSDLYQFISRGRATQFIFINTPLKYLCVCVCVCMRERERDGEGQR